MQCAMELSQAPRGPRTSPNTPSRACIVAWRGPGHFHRHWTARSLRSAPGQLGVVRVTRTRIGSRQKGGGVIWALAVSLSRVVKRICGLAVLLTAEREISFCTGFSDWIFVRAFGWGPPLCPQRGGRTSSKIARSPISGSSDPDQLETRSRSSRCWCRRTPWSAPLSIGTIATRAGLLQEPIREAEPADARVLILAATSFQVLGQGRPTCF
jgi:hypothetical protein